MLKYSLILALCLIFVFLIESILLGFSENSFLHNVLTISIIFAILIIYFREIETVKYSFFLKQGAWIGLISGGGVAVFVLFYITFIDTSYYENIAAIQVSKWRESGYDEFTINKMLISFGMMKKYHISELILVTSTLIKSVAISLVISPFFVKKVMINS